MMDSFPMTREGYNRLKKEIDRLENEEMPIIREQIATARAEGDLSENAEYHGAREKQGILQSKIDALKGKLGRAQIINPSEMPQDEIRFGATFVAKRLDDNKTLTYKLVGSGEEDPVNGKILVSSPLAKAFLGKKEGDHVEFRTPKGIVRKFTVESITHAE
ncbi:MAG: transcription elongation factor GreA [Thermoguttaceae bacterium]